MEEWRNIFGWEDLYQISSLGRVRSLRSGNLLKPFLTAGYSSIALCRGGKQITTYIHRLVCETWHGAPETGEEVGHRDNNHTNCRFENLRWISRTDNLYDQICHGTKRRGNQLEFTKVPDAKISMIRSSTRTQQSLADEFGVSRSLIGLIRQGARRAIAPQERAW